MKIYHYSPETGEYIKETEARESPLEKGVYLIPRYSTVNKPPAPVAGKVRVFNRRWANKEDPRGELYFDLRGEEHLIVDIGAVDASWSTTDPKRQEKEDLATEKNLSLLLSNLEDAAVRAELMELIDITTGQTQAAQDYRAEKRKQGR